MNPVKPASMFSSEYMEWLWSSSTDSNLDKSNLGNLELQMASSGYYECTTGCTKSIENLLSIDRPMNPKLNNAPASFGGNLIRFKSGGQTHHFMSTRNNNFSNRAQKSHIKVLESTNDTL